MLKFPEFGFRKTIFLFFTVLGLVFFSNESFAQTENEKVEDLIQRSADRPVMEESSNSKESSLTFPLPTRVTTNTSGKSAPNQVKRDLPAGGIIKEGEPKKESPSTLSFNIFLYIVDKFKEDKAE